MLAVYRGKKHGDTKWNPSKRKEDFGLFLLSLVRMARTWLHLWSTSIRWSRSSRLRRKRKVQILVQRLAGSRRTFVGCWMTGNDLLGMIWDDLVWLGQDLATWSLVDEQFSSWFLLQRVKLETEGPAGCYQSGEEIRRGCGWISCFFSFNELLEVSLGMRPMSKIESFSLDPHQGWLGGPHFFSQVWNGGNTWGSVWWRFLKIYSLRGHLQMV